MIQVRHLTVRYPGQEAPALQDVSLDVAPGEVVGIVGPNGSGKSTLGRGIKGLLLPDAGEVLVDGKSARVDGLEIRRLVGMVFQNPNSQIVNAVVEHEVAFGPENLGLSPPEIRVRVERGLAAVGLAGRATDEIHGLSMADKQRVAIAAVIAMEPRYLILDEPTTWLEPKNRWPVLEEVLRWGNDNGLGLILVTHRMDEAQACSRLYGMLDGRVEVVGSPLEVLGNEAVRTRLSLEAPEVLVLEERLGAAGLPVLPYASLERLAEALWRS
jgi:energy-coupling factor transport system ATP-binding protein